MFLDGKSLQEDLVIIPPGSILVPLLFLLCIKHIPDDAVCNIAIYADNTTLNSKCNQAFDFW